MKLKAIACGVFERELSAVAERVDAEVDVELLDAGLHARPKELRVRAQEAIDRASSADEYDAVVIVYGLCGRGTSGLLARQHPLVIPKVHDCISLFLGSRREYSRQFARHPGTFYMTAGWFEKKTHPDSRKIIDYTDERHIRRHPNYASYSEKYGHGNAGFLIRFQESWRKNYTRAAFIDHGLGDSASYESYAKMLAEAFGWQYERIPGRLTILERVLGGDWDDSDILVVRPGERVVATNMPDLLAAVPVDTAPARAASSQTVGAESPAEPTEPAGPTLGLGIDAGGTYTDAVLYDCRANRLLSKSKALTTHHELILGIEEALGNLEASVLGQVDLVALSTTLATNAIVEDRGAKAGLLLMPHLEEIAESVRVEPTQLLKGKLTITGEELEPVDPAEVKTAANELIEQEHVDCIAISGYASVKNPAHELTVKQIVSELHGVPIVCGHELSSKLNFINRAHTAALNAKLMPVVKHLVTAVHDALARHGVNAPLVVVKGDGSLMSEGAALERPIETVLSGPAASVAGARFLTNVEDALVIDMGGTTSDTALVKDGFVAVCPEGARVGSWRTSVEAADVLTSGLGGDSHVRLDSDGRLSIGPRRAVPIGYVSQKWPPIKEHLAAVAPHLDDYVSSDPLEFFVLVRPPGRELTERRESAIVTALAERPMSRSEIAARFGLLSPSLVRLNQAEALGIVRRAAITPTDMLHVTGEFAAWDVDASRLALELLAGLMKTDLETVIDVIREGVTQRLARLLIDRQLSQEMPADDWPTCKACERLFSSMVSGAGSDGYELRFSLDKPVVAIGAPVRPFLPEVARRLNTQLEIPEHCDVANAIGAVTSEVVVRETILVRPSDVGTFLLYSRAERREFLDLESAEEYARDAVVTLVRERARHFGTGERRVHVKTTDRTGAIAGGERLFLELVVEGRLHGKPALAAGARA